MHFQDKTRHDVEHCSLYNFFVYTFYKFIILQIDSCSCVLLTLPLTLTTSAVYAPFSSGAHYFADVVCCTEFFFFVNFFKLTLSLCLIDEGSVVEQKGKIKIFIKKSKENADNILNLNRWTFQSKLIFYPSFPKIIARKQI